MKVQSTPRPAHPKTGAKITTLLKAFGAQIPKGQLQNFWSNNSGELEYIFNDAKQGYLEAIKKSHPDTGGSEKDAKAINRNWAQIKKRFRIYYPKVFLQ